MQEQGRPLCAMLTSHIRMQVNLHEITETGFYYITESVVSPKQRVVYRWADSGGGLNRNWPALLNLLSLHAGMGLKHLYTNPVFGK